MKTTGNESRKNPAWKPRPAAAGRGTVKSPALIEGPVGKMLIRLTIPMIFGILSMVLYNLVDTFFVGRLGKDQLAALTFTFPVVLVIGSIAQGIGMGASAVVSRAIGANDHARVRRLATDSLVLALLIVGVFVILGLSTINPLFRLLGAEDRIIPYIGEYMRVWYLGMIFVVFPMVGNNTIRATGDSRTPGIVMMIGAFTNACLDPLFIFGIGPFPQLGIRGAALATVIGRSVTFLVALYVLGVREKLIDFKIPAVKDVLESWKEILYIGIPNAATKMIIPIGAGIITRIVSVHGAETVAGYGVATRIEFFSLATINALSSIIAPFVGQNLGAGRYDRVKEGYKRAELFSLVIGGVFFVLFIFLARPIAGIFNNHPEVIRTTVLYLHIVSIAYAFQGIYLVTVPALNVLRKPIHAASLSILEMFVLTLPLALLGSHLFGITGVFAALGVSYFLTGTASRSLFLTILKRTTLLSDVSELQTNG
jgi:putative MATE family efflux protein